VAFSLTRGQSSSILTGFADDEGTADYAHEGAAHELFFLPDAGTFEWFVSRMLSNGN